MLIPSNIVAKIKERASTFDIIQKFSDLDMKKDGVNYKACCPFHGEKTASFIVSPSKDIFKCFGCGVSGNGIDFIMQSMGFSYPDALRALANHYQITIPGNDNAPELRVIREKIINEKPLTAQEKELIEKESAEKISKQIFHLKKTAKDQAATYLLKERGLDTKLIPETFYYQGAAYKSKQGIDFPVSIAFLDSSEKFINKRFIGELPNGIAKSRNTGSMNNKIYDKTFQSGLKDVYLTEGVINAMSVFQCGKSALATFATSNDFTDPEILKKYLEGKNVFLAFDNDRAGKIYAVKFGKFLYDNDEHIRFRKILFVLFPEGNDANDCLKNNSILSILDDRYYHLTLDKNRIETEYKLLHQAKQDGNKEYQPDLQPVNIYNLQKAKPAIEKKGYACISSKYEIKYVPNDNSVCFNINAPEQLFSLKALTKNLVYIDTIPQLLDLNSHTEPQIYQVCKSLVAYGFNLKVTLSHLIDTDNGQISEMGFIQFYTDQLRDCITIGDTMAKTMAVKKAAEFLATLDSSTYIVEYANVYKKFNLNKADWNSIAKEFLTKEKHRQIYSTIAENDGPNIADITDPQNLPSYVDRNEFYRRGYFAAQNKEGKEVLYMFKSKEDGLFMASNFTMKMIGHLYHNERSKNKRIVKLTDEYGRDFFMEIESSTIRSFNDFSNRIYEESNLFFFGSKRQYEILLKHVSNNIPKWIELEILGQCEGDFFAFADGIYNYRDKVFMPIDELGTVSYKNITYYMPVFSSIYATLNGNNDKFSSARYLKYAKHKKGVDFNHTGFYEWTNLMAKVYPEDNAGMFAVIFVIMSAFRDFIFNTHRRFPLFFLSGPTNSGKSQVADSIQAPFSYGMQIYNLNSGTDAAFFVSLEKYRNVPMIFDEYNDVQISKIKFQGLKAGYDGVGKQKKKDITSKELDMSEVNCSIVYLGQEIPEQDDYALFNRSLSFFIPLKDYSADDTLVFDDLKKREELGLTNILTEILNHRHIIEKHYYKTQVFIKDNLKKELQETSSRFIERILNSISEYLAVFRIFLDYSDLSFAFSYDDFYQASKEKCIKLSEMVQSANRLATFFQTITYLFNIGRIIKGREFKIENRTEITIRKSHNETEEIELTGGVKVIFIRVNLIFPMYREIHKNESLKTSLLGTYLKDSQAYIGSAVNEDFEWFERKIIEKDNEIGGKYKTDALVCSKIRNTTAIALNYDKLDLELEKYSDEDNSTSGTDTGSGAGAEPVNEYAPIEGKFPF